MAKPYTVDAISKVETILLDRIKYAAQTRINMEVLHRAEVDSMMDYLCNQLILRVTTEVAQQKIDAQTIEIEEAPVYASPRHAYLDSLPEGSFRRRFLCYWWDIDPTEPLSTRRTHTITLNRWINYPNYVIPNLGPGVPIQVLKHETNPYWMENE